VNNNMVRHGNENGDLLANNHHLPLPSKTHIVPTRDRERENPQENSCCEIGGEKGPLKNFAKDKK